MRLLTTALSLTLLGLAAHAQQPFTSAALPAVGDAATMGNLPFQVFTNDFNAETGANYTWDFTAVMTPVGSLLHQYAYRDPSASTHGSNYPTATINWWCGTTGTDAFYAQGASDMTYLGSGVTPFAVPYTWISYPLNFAQGGTDHVQYGTPGQPISSATHTWTYDGWGTVQLPWQSFANVHRLKLVTIDSSFILNMRMITTQYLWVNSTGGAPVLRISRLDEGPSPYPAGYYDVLAYYGAPTGIAPLEAGQWSMAPNPASGTVRLQLPADARRVELIDARGVLVRQESARPGMTLDLDGLRDGAYSVRVITPTAVGTRPLVVRH